MLLSPLRLRLLSLRCCWPTLLKSAYSLSFRVRRRVRISDKEWEWCPLVARMQCTVWWVCLSLHVAPCRAEFDWRSEVLDSHLVTGFGCYFFDVSIKNNYYYFITRALDFITMRFQIRQCINAHSFRFTSLFSTTKQNSIQSKPNQTASNWTNEPFAMLVW